MRRHLRLTIVCVVAIAAFIAWRATPAGRVPIDTLPASLTDEQFWHFVETTSEPNGYFRSDNFLSNERGYQAIIPTLVADERRFGRVYLGVGPEQNFPYIIALQPKMAIIFDIRRGNLHEHLLYKALFEMSSDRADFLSRLWSRPRPAWLTKTSTVEELMEGFRQAAPSANAYAANLEAVSDWLTEHHGFPLSAEDLDGIDYVYRTAFYEGGPDLTYNMRPAGGGFGRGRMNSTYADIQILTDSAGVNRGFLANEENWNAIKAIEARNMVVPLVGDFGGPSAIRAVGAYLHAHGAVVSAFYLSNVEQYLNQDGKEDTFLCNVAALPLDDASTFIFTGGGRFGRRGYGGIRAGGGLNTTFLRPILPDTTQCGRGLSRLWR